VGGGSGDGVREESSSASGGVSPFDLKTRRLEGELTLGVVLIAVCLHGYEAFWSPSSGPDKLGQLSAAAALLNGEGYAIAWWNPATGGLEHAALNTSPPLYSLLVAGLVGAGLPPVDTAFLLDAAAVALFLFSWAILLRRIARTGTGVNPLAVMILWLAGASPVAAAIVNPSCILALALFSASLAMVVTETAAQTGAGALARGATGGLLMAGACLTRYAYVPLAVVAPFALLFRNGRRRPGVWWMAILYVAIPAVTLFPWLQRNQERTGSPTFLKANLPEPFDLGKLKRSYPFPVAALNLDSPLSRPILALTAGRGGRRVAMWVLAGLVSVACLAGLRRMRQARQGVAADGSASRLLAEIGLATMVLTVTMLVTLTLREPYQYFEGPDRPWTYVAEIRYYAPVLPFVVTSFFVWLHSALTGSRGTRSVGLATVAALAGIGVITALQRIDRVHSDQASALRRDLAVVGNALERGSDLEEPVVASSARDAQLIQQNMRTPVRLAPQGDAGRGALLSLRVSSAAAADWNRGWVSAGMPGVEAWERIGGTSSVAVLRRVPSERR